MAIIQTVRGVKPKIHSSCFLAQNAVVVGDVEIGEGGSVWFSAVLRGDVNPIRLGAHVNVQDGAVIHTLYQKSTVIIGNNVSIGHNAIIHGAHIRDGALIGMGAIVMDHAIVGEGAIIAAGSVVLSGQEIPPGTLYAGVPAKFIKDVPPHQSKELNEKIAQNYSMYASWFPSQDPEDHSE